MVLDAERHLFEVVGDESSSLQANNAQRRWDINGADGEGLIFRRFVVDRDVSTGRLV